MGGEGNSKEMWVISIAGFDHGILIMRDGYTVALSMGMYGKDEILQYQDSRTGEIRRTSE